MVTPIVTVRPKSENTQSNEEPSYSRLVGTISRRRRISVRDEALREVAMEKEFRERWVMKFDGFSTTQSGGVGVVLYHEEDKAVALSFKLEFPYSNNMAEYEAYLIGLATALEMGIEHLKVIGDLNLVVCQVKGSFSLKELSLVPCKTTAQKMEEKISTFKIEHAPRNEYMYADALAALSSQIIFERDSTRIKVNKRNESIVEMLKVRFQEEQCEEDWRIPIKNALKDYALVRGELYRRMPGGILTRCVG